MTPDYVTAAFSISVIVVGYFILWRMERHETRKKAEQAERDRIVRRIWRGTDAS